MRESATHSGRGRSSDVGTDCPLRASVDLVAGRWKPRLLFALSKSPLRSAELKRQVPAMSQRMMTLHLRELEGDGLVIREESIINNRRSVTYRLSGAAASLAR